MKKCCHGSPGNHRHLLSGSQNLGRDESARELRYEATRVSGTISSKFQREIVFNLECLDSAKLSVN